MTTPGYVKSGIVLGTTSAIALAAGVEQAKADNYIGFSTGIASGDSPNQNASTNDYELSGQVVGLFVGTKRDLGNGSYIGLELAFQGPAFANEAEDASYDYAYQINYVVDAKLRYGRQFGDLVTGYAFGGVSGGTSNSYPNEGGNTYGFVGFNGGLGVETDFSGVTLGLEYMIRAVDTFYDDGGSASTSTTHNVISARVSMDF